MLSDDSRPRAAVKISKRELMRHTEYFLVEPKVCARNEFPVRTEKTIADILLEPILTSRSYADRSSWRTAEAQLVVKLLYLARLREYVPLAEDEYAIQILGSKAIAENVFDCWWSIRCFAMEEGPSEQMHDYLAARADKVEPTGNQAVDEWLKSLKNS